MKKNIQHLNDIDFSNVLYLCMTLRLTRAKSKKRGRENRNHGNFPKTEEI